MYSSPGQTQLLEDQKNQINQGTLPQIRGDAVPAENWPNIEWNKELLLQIWNM